MKKIDAKLLDKKCFIFDIDGTLVDSMGMWNLVDQKVLCDKFGIYVDQMDIKMFRDSVLYNAQNVHGDIYKIYYDELVKFFNLGVTGEEFEFFRLELSNYLSINEIDYKKGAADFLKYVSELGKKIGVATTTTRAQYNIYEEKNQKMIKAAPLKKFVDVAVLCDDVIRKKPDPEAYLLVMKKLGAKPEDCIVFEDSLNGILAAKNAGIEVCAVYDDSAKNEQEIIDKIADYKFESFEELIKILRLDKNQNQPQ